MDFSVRCDRLPTLGRPLLFALLTGLITGTPPPAAASTPAAPATDVPSSPAVRLPSVAVSAHLPVVKVAEFHLREARFAPVAVAHGNFIYVIGGADAEGNELATVERLDLRTGKSTEFTHLEIPRRLHSAVVVDDRMFVLGGTTLGTGAPPPRSPTMNFQDNTAHLGPQDRM